MMDIGFAIWPKNTAEWLLLGLGTLPQVNAVVIETFDPESPPPLNLLVIDGDNPGPNFISFYKNYRNKHGSCPLIILGQPNSPALMAIEWEPNHSVFIAKPYLIQDVISGITAQLGSLAKSPCPEHSQKTPPKPIGYLSKLRLSDLLQMLCQSNWSGKIEAVNLARSLDRGEIYLDGGNITHACSDNITAEPAIYRMLAWSHCEFSLVADQLSFVTTVTLHWQEIMLEGARKIDEDIP